jgi:hypothetical protein
MATGTSEPMRRRRTSLSLLAVGLAAVLVIVIVSAGGGQSSHRPAAAFAWLRPAAAPTGWGTARTSGGAAIAYPPGWRTIKTDPGTASVALIGNGDRIDGYLNVTPKQGPETLANWSQFRTGHNRGEGDRNVRVIASSGGLSFRTGHGSCVIDTYDTSKATYREIACLVSGHGSTSVVVAAAPSALWSREAATLQRAVSSFTT